MPAPVAPTTLPPAPSRTGTAAQAPLTAIATALAAAGWDCTPHQSCDGEAMLVATTPDGAITCLVTAATEGLRLQRLQDEAWLDTECEGPPTRILARLGQIAAAAPSP